MSFQAEAEAVHADFHWFSRLKIRTRIVLIAAAPSLLVLWLILSSVIAEWEQRARLSQTLGIVNITGAVGDLVTALQLEAGLSATFASSHGKEMRSELAVARNVTSAAIKKLKDAVSARAFSL